MASFPPRLAILPLGSLLFTLLSLATAVQALASPVPGERGRLKRSSPVDTSHIAEAVLQRKTPKNDRHSEIRSILAAAEDPPEICFGHGSKNSIHVTDWEAGLESWTTATRNVANPATFDTEDWQTVGDLPDTRAGHAAFVANLNSGNCADDDETGVLMLTSPRIRIPKGTLVPRVSFDHWYEIESRWDGGNIRLIVNNGISQLVPRAAIEYNSYNSLLLSPEIGNSNPLAGETAYTETSMSWVQSWVNLYGLAEAGDMIQLQFDFGIDGCTGVVGWYVDNVQIYSCSEELPPSDCGNGVLDPGEQCDDGNTFIADGCSNTCKVNAGWECTDPLPPGKISDGGFETGTPNSYWTEASTNFNTPICDVNSCGLGTGSGPASGAFWAWFGGEAEGYERSSLQQSVTIPTSARYLTFELEASTCDSGSDYVEIRIDGARKFRIDGSDPLCESIGYSTKSVDISTFADGGLHTLEILAETFRKNGDVTNFFIDNIAIPGIPSECTDVVFEDSFESN